MNNQPENNQEQPRKHMTSAERQEMYKAAAAGKISLNKKKKQRRDIVKYSVIGLISLLTIAAIVAAVILNREVWQPAREYKKAVALYDSGDYLAAYDAFKAMGSYADAGERAEECIIANARKLAGKTDVIIGDETSMPWFSIDENGTIGFDDDVYVGDSTVTIPDVFNSILVRGIAERSFYYADFLTGVVIPPSVKTIGERCFFCCTSLTCVELPDSLEEIGEYAFSGCTALVSVKFGSGLRVIKQRAFRECSALESAVLPEGLTTIGVRAFNGCVSLTDLSLPSTLTTVGGYAFTECTSLERITFNGARGALEAACSAEDKEIILDCAGLRCKE